MKLPSNEFPISESDENELKELTGESTGLRAIVAAVRFTLMHDKDSVREALKDTIDTGNSAAGETCKA